MVEFKNNLLTVEWLKANAKSIHYFGLGFIQIKLNNTERLHFYTNLLPKTTEEEEIHNHRYNFVSTILKGSLNQEIYLINNNADGEYKLQEVTCQEDTGEEILSESFTLVSIEKFYESLYVTDETYYINHNDFHKVGAVNNTITYLRRSPYTKPYAEVIFKKDKELTCPFTHKFSEEELYDIINNML